MASWQAHFLDVVMRMQVKRRLRGKTDLAEVRSILAGGNLPYPAGVTFRPDTVGGIAGEWAETSSPPRAILLYLHGGGYFACSPRTHRPITGAYAKAGFSVFVPDYRLAPENPYPAAIEDAHAAWDGLVALGHAPETLTVSGDSAGGGLALALLLTLRDQGGPMPAAAALLSPWADMACTGASTVSNAKRDAMFTVPGLHVGASLYLGGADARSPLASPVYADYQGLPPLLIHVGEREIMRDDSTRVADHARDAGIEVDLRVWNVVPHVWQLARFVPEARESMRLAATFLLSHAG